MLQCLLFFQDLPIQLKFLILFAVAATPTPLTSLLSGAHQLHGQLKALPQSYVVYNMYLRCLLYYFLVMNMMMAVLYGYVTHHWIIFISASGYTLVEVISYVLLEKYFSLKHWKIKKEL